MTPGSWPPARSRPFWPTVVATLILGLGAGIATLDLVRAGRSHPDPLASPTGMPIPPLHVEMTSGEAPSDVAEARVWGGPREGDTLRPRSIAEEREEALDVILDTLTGAAAAVLLVAAANIALLLLARGRRHGQDVAVRRMLGATRMRLVVQLAGERFPLLLLSCGIGAAVAALVRSSLHRAWPGGLSPWLAGSIDVEVAAMLSAAALLLVAFCSVLPALLLDERSLGAAVGAARRATPGPGQGRIRDRITVVGIACSVTLLVASGLLVRSFAPGQAIGHVPYDPRDTLMFVVQPESSKSPQELVTLGARLTAAVQGVNGVDAALLTSEGAWLGLGSMAPVHTLTGYPARPGILGMAAYTTTTPAAFSRLGVPILEGRDFVSEDGEGAPAVAIVNRTFANRLFFDSPIGRLVQLGRPRFETVSFTVVGVVEDIRPPGIGGGAEPEPVIALSALQVPPRSFELAARFTGDAEVVSDAVEHALATAVPDAIVVYTGTLEERLADFRRPLAWFGTIIAMLAGLSALLGTYGLYGLVAYNVATRTREIGIRLALGARPNRVVQGLLLEGLRLSLKGMVLGIAGALCTARLMQATFAGIQLIDPFVYLPVLGLTAAIALLASYLPARAAADVDPIISLAHD